MASLTVIAFAGCAAVTPDDIPEGVYRATTTTIESDGCGPPSRGFEPETLGLAWLDGRLVLARAPDGFPMLPYRNGFDLADGISLSADGPCEGSRFEASFSPKVEAFGHLTVDARLAHRGYTSCGSADCEASWRDDYVLVEACPSSCFVVVGFGLACACEEER